MLDRAVLCAAWEAGRPIPLYFFYGHRPAKDGRVTASCLSQWWEQPFRGRQDGGQDGGQEETFPTAEHWMMAGKARLFGDEEIRAQILAAPTPGRAKALGRKVRGFTEEGWRANRSRIVTEGNVAKFGAHPDLRRFLLGTGDAILVEASPSDRIWGIGLAADDPRAADPRQWRGENLLGFALVEARAILRGGAGG